MWGHTYSLWWLCFACRTLCCHSTWCWTCSKKKKKRGFVFFCLIFLGVSLHLINLSMASALTWSWVWHVCLGRKRVFWIFRENIKAIFWKTVVVTLLTNAEIQFLNFFGISQEICQKKKHCVSSSISLILIWQKCDIRGANSENDAYDRSEVFKCKNRYLYNCSLLNES